MSRPKIVDVNYFEFREHLAQAIREGGRIEKGDKERWKAYLRDHKINDVSMLHLGKSRYDVVDAVILDCGQDWDGFYVYSKDEEAVLKWTRTD